MGDPRRMRLVLNGKAAADAQLREAVAALRNDGHQLQVRVTWEKGDAARFAREAVEEDLDLVLAAGGDGTLNEVVNGVFAATQQPSIAVGALPYGTANDFATACEIPLNDPTACLRLAAGGSPTAIDVGRVNDRCFINVASGGFGADVTASTPSDMKSVMGGMAYSLMGLVKSMSMTRIPGRVITPDGVALDDAVLIAVGNSRRAGGGYEVAPRALLNDGRLDLLVVREVEISRMGELLSELLDIGNERNQHVYYRQLSEFSIEGDVPFHLNADGEPMRESKYSVGVIKQKLKFLLPEECNLILDEPVTQT